MSLVKIVQRERFRDVHAGPGVAYKAACVFGLGNPPRPNAPTEAPMPWVEQELRRRIFWATWLTNCINSEHYTVGTSVNDDILNFPLPADDLSFRNSVEVPPVTTRDALEQQKTQVSDRSRAPPSIMAELVKLMMIWLDQLRTFVDQKLIHA